jgi:hypothetical protein
MKCVFLLILFLSFGFSNLKDNPSDFDYKLSEIVNKFKQEIMDKDECNKQKNETYYLSRNLEEALNLEGQYTQDEKYELRKLKKEADALEDYISSVGDCGNFSPTIEYLNLANERIGGSISYLIKDKFCVDVISVTIDDYVAILLENNTNKSFTISYQWTTSDGILKGNGTMGLPKRSVRHIYDNRDNRDRKNISIIGITCNELQF